MDHATRHLSSPSPTSSFLFHHSEKSYKSNDLLTPLLSSETEDSDVNACFSATTNVESATIENFSNQSDEEPSIRYTHQGQQDLLTKSDSAEQSQQTILEHFCGNDNSLENIHNGQTNLALNHHDIGRSNHLDENGIRDDEVDDDEDDEDESMRHMLSGSSGSSATTMPLLSDAHTHHSFSERISLEEYSPLSLVNDCDNALPMSPTSLACGSHHSSFKSSLNNLKIDHLGVEGVTDVGTVHGVDDVVGDTRSMSPSLLNNTNSQHHHHHHNHNHHNMWSNSSTAITQNPSLLTSTSTSILLSQHSHHPNQHSHHNHHQNQMNTLMQQLEPQSLDEPPPLIGNNGSGLDSDINLSQHAQILPHRPSSEPPLNSGIGVITSIESRHANNNLATSSSSVKTATSTSSNNRAARTQLSSSLSASISLNGVDSSNELKAGCSLSTTSRLPIKSKSARSRQRNIKAEPLIDVNIANNSSADEKSHNSKLHLLLNHHKKLKELQQRLFGNNTPANSCGQETDSVGCIDNNDSCLDTRLSQVESAEVGTGKLVQEAKEEADSSANKGTIINKQEQYSDLSADQIKSTLTTKPTRQNTRRRRPPPKNQPSPKTGDVSTERTTSNSATIGITTTRSVHKIVKTETAEPDTTTKSSDCLKLADLLTSNNSVESTRAYDDSSVVYKTDSPCIANDGNHGTKKIQHIQVHMNPSLTVVANDGLIQPNNIQQQQLNLSDCDNGATARTSGNHNMHQCQTINNATASFVGIDTSGTTAGPLFKCNIVTEGDVTSGGSGNETGTNDSVKKEISEESHLLLNWPMAINSNGNNRCDSAGNINTHNAPTTTIGAHQIAIQVICQDGTSLVLPVSSATSLNTAVTLSAQNQAQIQAILANGNNSTIIPNCQQNQSQLHRANSAQQMIPIVTMVNNRPNNVGLTTATNLCSFSSQKSNNNSGSASSGLAASSPTLAALLDAGSNRGTSLSANSSETQGSNFISSNLLRKFTTSAPVNQNQIAICEGGSNSNVATMVCSTSNGIKRIKFEANNETCNKNSGSNNNNNIQTATLTLINPRGLIVTNGNESDTSIVRDGTNNGNNICSDMTSGIESSEEQNVTKSVQSNNHGISNSGSLQISQQIFSVNTNNGGNNKNKIAHECTINKQLTKMTSSTGNRQVDPAQPFRCEHCNSTFTRLGNFTRHKKIHTVPTKDGQRFKCDVCSKSFLQRCDLARHLHIHRGTEPHRCNICGKGYIRHSDLVTHQRFHNKEKPFGCPHCSKGFCQRGDLNRHLRSIHLQMKPILCPCCNRKFAKQETLLRHLNTAHRGTNKSIVAGTSSSGQTNTNDSPAYQIPVPTGNKKSNHAESISTVAIVSTGGGTTLNGNGHSEDMNISSKSQKTSTSLPVASLQAIQATLCKVQQSVDPSKKMKLAGSSPDGPTTIAKAAS